MTRLVGVLIASLISGTGLTAGELSCFPPQVTLRGAEARQRVVVAELTGVRDVDRNP